jgi:hypothetical protein
MASEPMLDLERIRRLQQLDVAGRRVFVRADLDGSFSGGASVAELPRLMCSCGVGLTIEPVLETAMRTKGPANWAQLATAKRTDKSHLIAWPFEVGPNSAWWRAARLPC